MGLCLEAAWFCLKAFRRIFFFTFTRQESEIKAKKTKPQNNVWKSALVLFTGETVDSMHTTCLQSRILIKYIHNSEYCILAILSFHTKFPQNIQ